MRNRIYITDEDCERLRGLIARRRSAANAADHVCLDMLEQELDRAEVVDADDLPRDAVTMNSETRIRDLDSGAIHRYKLVFPNQFRWDNSVSVLAPIGAALLGCRVGDVIEWPVPRGVRRLKILEVLRQPEPADALEAGARVEGAAWSRSGN